MEARLKPFWLYFGAKWRAAPMYPPPYRHKTIIEPFAGAAGYSLCYPDHDVILVEKYDVIAGIWDYLIHASVQDVLSIPLVQHVDELPASLPAGARDLVAFNLGYADSAPRRALSQGHIRALANAPDASRVHAGWGEPCRERVAAQVERIRHWKIIHGDYTTAPDVDACWFVDPPYVVAGEKYHEPASAIDYGHLGAWCKSRKGQVTVCENDGATWLPFRPFSTLPTASSMGKGSHEVIWTNVGESMTQAASVDMAQPAAEWVEVDALLPWVKNPRKNDAVVDKIAESIKAYGFGAPLIARRANGEVIGGHTRLKAAILLGMTHVPVRYLDLDEKQAHALALADNKLGELAEWDDAMLQGVLNDLAQEGIGDLSAIGFSNEELLKLLATTEVDTGESVEDRDAVVTPPDAAPPSTIMSHVKMVQLFFDQAQFDEFTAIVRELSAELGTKNASDTTLEVMRARRAAQVKAS